MTTRVSEAEIIRLAMDSRLMDVHVALPCRVVTYYRETQTVDVLPMVRRAIHDTEGKIQHEDLPILPNLPVCFPRGGTFSQSWDLVAGDFVLVVFCSWAIGQWRESADISNPVDLRKHDLSHGVAIPGLGGKTGMVPFDVLGAPLITADTLKIHAVVEVGDPVIPTAVPVSIAALVDARIGELADAILNAMPASGDGGAALQAAAKVTLAAAGWTGGGVIPPTTESSNLKAEP